jgi:hypothetical protein
VFFKILKQFQASLSLRSHLRLHVEGRCFTCHKKDWKSCPCRTGRQQQLQYGGSSSSTSSSSMAKGGSSSRSSSSSSKAVILPIAMKSRSGSKRKPMARVRPVGRQVPKKSGRPKSGFQRSQDLGLRKGTDEFMKFKYGDNPKTHREKVNRKHYRKRTAFKRPACK